MYLAEESPSMAMEAKTARGKEGREA